MFPLFGFFSEERIEAKKTWREDWLTEAEAWQGEDGARLDAFVFGSMPDALAGTADAVLMIRALHNLNRFEDEGGYRSTALADAFRALKPGGVLAVVQHEAPPERDRAWADGSRGYLLRDQVIEVIEAAGFEFEQSSDINSNPLDQPGEDDIVWRLPPSLSGSADDPARRSAMEAIGESNRMTLRFRKPG
jgi:predicted methyltransferase